MTAWPKDDELELEFVEFMKGRAEKFFADANPDEEETQEDG